MKGGISMTKAECQVDTLKHIETVRQYIWFFCKELTERGIRHDKLKLMSPEVEAFAKAPALSGLSYDSPEYETSKKSLEVALSHHYAHYRHHPEHFANGINDMDLIDIVEMICDWKASSLRQHDGNLLKSIEANARRFGYNDQIKQILTNTAKILDDLPIG